MADVEEYFPRGGKKPKVAHFKQSANFLGGIEKEEKRKKKPKKKSEGDDDGYLSDDVQEVFDQSHKNCAFGINYKIVKEGLLILGRVRELQDTKMHLSLPCKMFGTVMACYISESYNKLLEAYVNDKIEKVKDLTQMFRVGQYIAVRVLEMKDRLMLSIMPQHVNGGKTHSDLYKGALLQGAVSSVEDHGYVIDLGIPNTRAFLAKGNTNPDIDLDTGIVTWCCVKSVSVSTDSSIITLSNQLEVLQQALQRRNCKSPLLPGTAVEFVIHKPLDNGIEGHMFGETVAYVQRQHVDTVKGKKPAIGQKVRARVLYVVPTRNTPFLTMKNIFETTYPDVEKEQKFKDGDIIDDAQVIKITSRSIIFKLVKGSIGVMSVRRLQVHEELSDEEIIAKSYPIGSTHRVRILCYNLSDFCYSVSDEPQILQQRYFSLEQLAVGEIVEATVTTVADWFIRLDIGRITGIVPNAHLTDAGTITDPKQGIKSKLHKKKYKEGQNVKARVLVVDPVKQQVLLTLKPSLLSPDLEILQSYDQAAVGKSYTGIIKHIKEYLLVSFFNNVIALVPRHLVSRAPPDNLLQAYHVGQIVKCTIIKADAEAKKMTGSLITEPFDPDQKRKNPRKRKEDTENPEVPNKKHKLDATKLNDDESDMQDNELEETNNNEKKKKRKLKNSEQESHTKEQDEMEGNEEESNLKQKKKKNKNTDENFTDLENEQESDSKSKKKKDRRKSVTEVDNNEMNKESEESDPIDTDIHDEDSDQVLQPQDLELIDLSDCATYKKCKKRVVSLLKAVNARARRIDRIEQKIQNIERKGLNARNKKFHTAMHLEKLTVQERIKKLLEALKTAQEKLKEMNPNDDENKEKKDDKKIKTENHINTQDSKKTAKSKKDRDTHNEIRNELKEPSKKTKKNKNIKILETAEPALEVPSVKDFWSANPEVLPKKVVEDDSSSSEDDEKEVPKKKRKKLTVSEKIAKAREEEERVREMERRAAEGSNQPRSADQFERALLANPNCSQLWIAYMAFHLQATEIEKARAVGRKALNTISFREEQEKLNVWLAMINFENRFGTKESQQATLDEALQMNEPFQIHSKLLDIYVETSKPQELSSLVDRMMRKYRQEPTAYTSCGAACYKLGLVDKARHVMQKAIMVLDKKEHVPLLVQFALMERTAGEVERAEALFEQVLAAYPQRVDVCAAYVDMLIKAADIEPIRQVMERMTSQKLPARKMKVLFKKWVEAEEKIGDKEQVEQIQQRAMDYIDKAKF